MKNKISGIRSVKSPRQLVEILWRRIPLEDRRKLLAGRTGVILRKVKRRLGFSQVSQNHGLLTVVIPVYNVEEYLEECVLSVVGQSYRNLQILLVDDGSTDSSRRIARKLARFDRRIRVISKKNNGLGAARNTGIESARGKYLAFVDSDDIVPTRAYEKMIDSLVNTGSDFAVGSIHRLKERKRSVPNWAQEVHAEDRLATTLAEYPDILHNVFAWNKVFRRDFWDSTLKSFPEGILYEDQEVTAKAYAEAKAFDVLHTVVYDWRIRSDRSSITQQKDNIRDLTHRMIVTERVNDYLSKSVDTDAYHYWLVKVLGPDLAQYYVQVPRVDDEYWNVLQKSVSQVLETTPMSVLQRISVHERVLLACISADNRAAFEAVVFYNAENGRSYPIDRDGGSLYASPGYLPLLQVSIDKSLLMIDPSALLLVGELKKIELAGDSLVAISGHAYVQGLKSSSMDLKPVFQLVNSVTGQRLQLLQRFESDPLIDLSSNDAWTSYADSAFRVDIDLALIESTHGPAVPRDEWFVEAVFEVCGEVLSGRLTSRKESGAVAMLPLVPIDDNHGRWIFRHSRALGLSFVRETYKREVASVAIVDRKVTLELDASDVEAQSSVLFRCKRFGFEVSASVSMDEQGRRVFVAELPELPSSAHEFTEFMWSVKAIDAQGISYDLAWPGSYDRYTESLRDFSRLRIQPSGYGYLQLSDRRSGVRVEDWHVDAETEVVTVTVGFVGEQPLVDLPVMVFVNGRSIIESIRQDWLVTGRQAEYIFGLRTKQWNMYDTAVDSGMYSLRHVSEDDSGKSRHQWVEVASAAQQNLPEYHSTSVVNLVFARTPKAGALSLRVGPPLHSTERGKLMQGRLHRSVVKWLAAPIYKDAVLFETFGGKTIGDSCLGIFNEMMQRDDPRPKYWSVRDHSVSVPEGATAVVMYSADWYRILHTAEYVVNNNNFPFFYRKHPEQKYIQVWHGTPLKRIGNDISNSTLSLPYINLMKKEARYWDYLLAQNEFASDVLPRAFGYEGTVVDEGYPRNDSLVDEYAADRRAKIRENLGIVPGKRVVLYAPTWRDNVRTASNHYDFVSFLDLNEAATGLGDDFVFLIRGHHNVADQRYTSQDSSFLDVTSYPNINDLILASDYLVTDYSSVMFDYSVTGKPIFLLAPDIDIYRNKTRGFYFDIEECPPGPIVMDTSGLVSAIRRHDSVDVGAKDYSRFKSRFAPSDDGEASSRVYELLWGKP